MTVYDEFSELLKDNQSDYPNQDARDKADAIGRMKRIEMCGKFSSVHLDPNTGKQVRRTHYCKNWRECETCKKRRVAKLTSGVKAAISNSPDTVVSVCNESEWASLSQRIKTDEYVRFPVEGGKSVIVHNGHKSILKKAEVTESMSSMDQESLIERVSQTPHRKRISGRMGGFSVDGVKPKKEEPKEDPVEIQVKSMVINTVDKPDLDKIQDEVKKRSKSKKTFDHSLELQSAIIRRERLFIEVANEMGFYVRIDHIKKVKVYLRFVDWT
jgi:hypothetical protein